MSQTTIGRRVAELEQKVADLEMTVLNGSFGRNWRSAIGTCIWDETAKRVDEEIRKAREKNRREARRDRAGRGKAKNAPSKS